MFEIAMATIIVLVLLGLMTFLGLTIYSIVVTLEKIGTLKHSLISFAFHDPDGYEDRVIWIDSLPDMDEMSSYWNTFKNPEKFVTGQYAEEFFIWQRNPVHWRHTIQ